MIQWTKVRKVTYFNETCMTQTKARFVVVKMTFFVKGEMICERMCAPRICAFQTQNHN